ncbi:hypothetical protein F0344_20625 [Streptomyces finlayi]|uniref:DUF4175 domain-containing protein n=1 Tax=Streptomyces finlayi TaxID=67296 RepID=A0A7G7BMZ3_9ACTN|nr:hypothetical protein [Streptomyces finlayi]QNE76708.1 hypothetical protein F0344_20625 [Streptomyces finlayi]
MLDDLTDLRDSRAWIAPLVSTLVTLPLAFFAIVFGGLSPMACDSCSDTESDRFDASFGPAWTVLCCGLVLSLILLVVAWAVPWQQRNAARRVLITVLAPASVFLTYVTFAALIDWP